MMDSNVKTATIREAVDNEDALFLKGKVEKKSGKRIGYYYIILKSLKQSKKNDVVKCIYIKGLTNFGFCVIKEGSFGDSKDKEGRDIQDRLRWQERLHSELYGKIKIPKLLGSFEENGNYYLVMEYIKGRPLHNLFRKKGTALRTHMQAGNVIAIRFLDYILQVLDILNTMHSCEIVHRDVTPNNFLVTYGGNVAVIDMELSYSLKDQLPSPPFQLGTAGYMSPSQEAMLPPTIEDDIFAVGAIMFSAFTGVSAYKLTRDPYATIIRRVHFLIDDMHIAEIILQALHPRAEERPSVTAIKDVIFQFRRDLMRRNQRPVTHKLSYSKDEVFDTLQTAITALGSPLWCDPEKGWFSENLKVPGDEKNKINKAWYASLSNGVAGIIYFLAKVQASGMDVSADKAAIQSGMQLIQVKYFDRIEKVRSGLYMGADGVAVSLAAALNSGLEGVDANMSKYIEPLLKKQAMGLGIAYGAAGQGLANLLCRDYIELSVQEKQLNDIVVGILDRQERDGSWNLYGNMKKPRFTRGFANGAAGIIYFLLEYSQRTKDLPATQAAVKGLHWLMNKSVIKNGTLIWKSSKGKELQPWQSEGIAGITLPFIRAYQLYGDEEYRKIAERALQSLHPAMLNNSLSQGQGLAGLGEVYLQAFVAFHDEVWHNRASHVLQVLMHLKREDANYGPYWLVEREKEPTATFTAGNTGILHFLLRFYMPTPGAISFPFLP